MKRIHLMIVPTLILILGFTGCDNSGVSRSSYPDRSQETKAEADAIRAEQEQRNQAIDRDLQQAMTSLSFSKQQSSDKARLERDKIAFERDQKIQPLEAQINDAEAKAKRECERVDQEAKTKAATANSEDVAKIKAEATIRTTEIKSETAKQTAELEADIRTAQQAAQVRVTQVDDKEAKELSALDAKRIEAENHAREARLLVAKETTDKLDVLAKDSAKRQTQRAEADDRITSSVRQSIVRQGNGAQGITVTTNQGVVVLTGTAGKESIRQAIVKDAEKIEGVVRVEDRIAVH